MRYLVADFKICCPSELLQTARDILADTASQAGFEAFEDTDEGLKGYVQKSLFDKDTLEYGIDAFPLENTQIAYSMTEAEDKDWNETWEQSGFEPISISPISPVQADDICAPCLTIAQYKGVQPQANEILIDAKLAFGSGTHETTQMMVATLLSIDLKGKRILDCGCGTGILSIAALKLGASKAVGYDIDEWSVKNTRHNAMLNGVGSRLDVVLGDSSVLKNNIGGKFDIVLANINRNILLHDMPAFKTRLASGGLLIISGFYRSDLSMLEDKTRSLGLCAMSHASKGDWCCAMFKRMD